MDIQVRNEHSGDEAEIHQVTRRAFLDAPHTDHTEQHIVDALRQAGALEAMGAFGCVVLGEPGYYGRFGFRAVDGLIYPGVPAEYFQALSFSGGFPQGEVSYHEAFSAQA